ncbi:MAG: hypothetical protein WC807_18925 [Hyphomicrobium sp.]
MSAVTKSKALELPRDPLVAEMASGQPRSDHRQLEILANRFDPARRAAVRRLLFSSSRLADLALVFPGALYALAARQGPATRRRKALELIERGAPLKVVAQTLELPLWLRRLPPEAFDGPIVGVPQSEVFGRRIANHLPRTGDDYAFWLRTVCFGAKACDEYFALWLAQQPIFSEAGDPERLFGVLAAYAWFSSADASSAHNLIVVAWRPEMALDTAVCAAKSWLNRLRLVLQLRDGTISDPWLEAGEARGLSFVPLIEEEQILAEAHAMQNCADQYADRLAREKCRLFSVRRRGVRLATLEIGPHPREAGVLAITQLKARHNMPASAEVWQSAHAWLGTQKGLKRLPVLALPDRPLDQDHWQSLMIGYRSRKRGAAWLPETASRDSFAGLDRDIAELARRAGITSWLFT